MKCVKAEDEGGTLTREGSEDGKKLRTTIPNRKMSRLWNRETGQQVPVYPPPKHTHTHTEFFEIVTLHINIFFFGDLFQVA